MKHTLEKERDDGRLGFTAPSLDKLNQAISRLLLSALAAPYRGRFPSSLTPIFDVQIT
jgi:hypothetical protein